ncbi:hypothetical protein BH20CHL4_BH20CHL4_09010 [soil metagenome]
MLPFPVLSSHFPFPISHSINENYRELNKPYFSTVNLMRGGDPKSAAAATPADG